MKKHLPAGVFFIVMTLLLEILVQLQILNSSLIPAPTEILRVLLELRVDFQRAFVESFSNVLVGFFASVVFGIAIAGLFSLSDLLRRAILPFAVFFQTVPIIAIAPLLVIYFGFGSATVIASSFIVALFPMIANTLIGLESTQPSQRDLFFIYKATGLQNLWHLKLPSAFSSIYAGLKVSAGLAIIGAVAGEFVAGGGLGALIDSARTQQRVDIVFAALLLLSLMGLLLMAALALGKRVLLKYRPFVFSEDV